MDKREEILDSALNLFSQNGFRGTSLSQIATGAKTQKQLITHHFGTKDKLWREVVDNQLRDGVHVLRRTKKAALQDGAEAGVRAFVIEYIQWVTRKQALQAIMVFDSQTDNPRFQWYTDNYFNPSYDLMTGLISESQKTGRISTEQPGRLYFTIINLINSLLIGSLTFKIYTDRDPNNADDIAYLKSIVFKILEMEDV